MQMRRVLVIFGAVLVGASLSEAQSYLPYLTKFQHTYVDYELAPPPCVSTHPVSTTSFEGALWFTWTCTNGEVYVRGPAALKKYRADTETPTCDPAKMIVGTNLNECQWFARYPR